jgi:hypothetical protein
MPMPLLAVHPFAKVEEIKEAKTSTNKVAACP